MWKFGGNGRLKKNTAIKDRILKNREGLVEAMSQSITDVKQCPYLMASKCITVMCEHFMKFRGVKADGTHFDYHRCVHKEMPLLMIELIVELRKLSKGRE